MGSGAPPVAAAIPLLSLRNLRLVHYGGSLSLTPRHTMNLPLNIQLIGPEVAIAWDDGTESYFPAERLRAASPSASNIGERDVLGNQYGGNGPKQFPGVTVLGWERVGNYALRFDFSDGHRTGLYSFDFLRVLAASA